MEVWKTLTNFEDYEVSNFGRIRRRVPDGRYPKHYLLHPNKKSNGYRIITLINGNRKKCLHMHRLVAEMFIGKCPIGLEVNHKDSNRENNVVENLEYMTRSENLQHASQKLRMGNGERNHTAVLTSSDVIEIRRLLDEAKIGRLKHRKRNALTLIAKQFCISNNHVSAIGRRTFWKHIP